MNIKLYLEQNNITQIEFAHLVNVTPGMVYQWIKGLKPISPEKCVLIEQKTGKLTRKMLRPDDWHEIWPELVEAA